MRHAGCSWIIAGDFGDLKTKQRGDLRQLAPRKKLLKTNGDAVLYEELLKKLSCIFSTRAFFIFKFYD